MSQVTAPSRATPQDLSAILSAVFAAWSRAHLPFVVLRNYTTLPQHIDNDLDLLVPAARLAEAEHRLLETTSQQGWRLWHRVEFSPISLWFTHAALPYLLHIDLFDALRWRGIEIISAEAVLGRRRRGEVFDIPSPVDEAIINLLTTLLYQGFVKEKYKDAIVQAFHTHQAALQGVLRSQFGAGLAAYLAEAVLHQNWGAIEAQATRLRMALAWRSLRRQPVVLARALCRDAARLSRRLVRPPGAIVALVGPDGVGKSSVIHEVRKQLAEARLFNQTIVRHWRPGLLPPLKRLLGGGPPRQDGPPPRRERPGRYHWLRLAYYGLDFVLGHLLKDLWHISRLRLVMYDRCALDMAVDPLRYGLPSAVGARLMSALIPTPDLVIFLHDTSARILARKQELAAAELDRQLQVWQDLAIGGEVDAVLPVDDTPEIIASRIKDLIIEAFRHQASPRKGPSGTQRQQHSLLFPDASETTEPLALSSRLRRPDSTPASPQEQRYAILSLKGRREYLIPLGGRPAAARALDLYSAQTVMARCGKQLLTLGLRWGLAQPFMRQVCLSDAPNGASEHAGHASLLEHLRQVIGLPEVQFGISVGTPGPHRKPVLLALTPQGSPLGYVKVGWNEATNELVQNEAQTLQHLDASALPSCALPRIQYAGWWHGHFLCLQSPTAGTVTAAPRALAPAYLAIAGELAALHTRWLRLHDSAFWSTLRRRMERISNAYYRHILQRGARTAEAWLDGGALPFHYSHGDFAPWNARMLGHGLLLFDWEYAAPEALPGYDLMHFAVQTARLLKRWSPGQICLWMQHSAPGGRQMTQHFEKIGLKGADVTPLLLLYVLDRLAFYAAEPDPSWHTLQYFAHMANLLMLKEPPTPCPPA